MKIMRPVIISLLLTFISLGTYAQAIDNFFKYEGGKLIADLAHPTNTLVSATFNVMYDHVKISIYYEECYTEVDIIRDGIFFTGIEIVKDTDFFSPFAATEIIKDFILEAIESDKDREELSKFEQKINKKIHDMSGEDLACLFLTLSWWAYDY